MRRYCRISAAVVALLPLVSACHGASPEVGGVRPAANQTPGGEYKVLTRARVGGEGGTDYIYADVVGRRLYIPRGGSRAVAATDTSPAKPAVPGRITIFDLESLAPLGEIPNTGGQGVAVDPKSGHGFSSSRPISMFDTRSMQLIKTIDPNANNPAPNVQFGPDGIYFDSFDQRVYVFSHPTHDAIVIDARDGTVIGKIPLPGTPEQAVSDGKGTLYVVMQDSGSVAVVDVRAMKTTTYYPFGGNTGCNGLALDVANRILFAACSRVGAPVPPRPGVTPPPPQPMMVILSAVDGRILAKLPLAGGSDGAAFNPATMEAFSSHGNGTMTIVKENSPTSFVVEQNLDTMNGARTLTLDTKTNRLFVMSVERGPAPPPPVGGGRGGQAPPIPGSFTILMIGR